MDKLKMQSPDRTQDAITAIQALFPHTITEVEAGEELTKDGKSIKKFKKAIDFELLRQTLSDQIIEDDTERYRLDWPGKKASLLKANSPIQKTLRPAPDESVDWEKTQNLYIEGDNLEALKILQESYLGKVKMIYIDPPYNTGNDFIYKDDFKKSREEYEDDLGLEDESGEKLFRNTDSNGRFHSDWLSMMYERLLVARDVLREDGVIFISIDDNEVHNLRKICDEIFGEENFVECISWNKRIPKNDKGIGNIHEYVLIYSKNSSNKLTFTMKKDGLEDIYELLDKLKKNNISINESEFEIKKLYKKNGYDRGITLYNSLDKDYRLWGKINMSWPNADTFGPKYNVYHPITKKIMKVPERGWRWKEDTFNEAANLKDGKYETIEKLNDGSYICNRIWFAKDESTQPSSIIYLDEVNRFLLRSILSFKSDGGIELESLFEGKSFFSYPKPSQLISVLIGSLETSPSDIILDFFSGSATTAHAVMALNAEDGGNRKFILVQLPEKTDENSEAYKAGFTTIAEIGKERIRRAAKKIREDLEAKNAGSGKKPGKKKKDEEAVLLQAESDETETEASVVDPNSLDLGFRVFKVDSSNMKDVFYNPAELSQDSLYDLKENVKEDRTQEDLLIQVMLDLGLVLSLPMESRKIKKNTVYFVDGNALVACFDSKMDSGIVDEIAKLNPLRVVFRDSGFADDKDRINLEERFKRLSPNTKIVVI
jgi:adenine-specific DNA-methyltransferase